MGSQLFFFLNKVKTNDREKQSVRNETIKGRLAAAGATRAPSPPLLSRRGGPCAGARRRPRSPCAAWQHQRQHKGAKNPLTSPWLPGNFWFLTRK